MNIVCYINKISDGGAERVMSVLANSLADRGHAVTLVADYATPKEYPLVSGVDRIILDGDFTEVSSKGRVMRQLRRIVKLRYMCQKKKADILVSFMSEGNARAILATRFLRTKNLISVRLDPKISYKGRAAKIMAKVLYPLADGCVFQTKDAQSWFSPKIQKRSQVIFNPVSDAFYRVEPVEEHTKRIVTCGRLDRQKRFDLLIDAFAKVCEEFADYKLEIYGQGNLEAELQERINALGKQDRITLMGRCEDIPNAIKDAGLFVLSSDYEGLPNALMEAMALGLPVISTDCGGGGARALIDHGKDGLIVPCDDVDALAGAIRESLRDSETMMCRGQCAREKAAGFAADRIVNQWVAYIQDIVKKK